MLPTDGSSGKYTDTALERLRSLPYKAVRKVTGGFHGARPARVKLWDMRVFILYIFMPPALNPKSYGRARVLEAPSRPMGHEGVGERQDPRGMETLGPGRSWKGHSLAWAPA